MIKKYLPFITVGFFMLSANLLLVVAIFELRGIDTITLATINFGIYIMALFGIFCESFSKLLTIRLSKVNPPDFKKILVSTYIKITPIMILLITIVIALLMIFNPQHLVLIIVIYTIALLLYLYLYLRAWINALENYIVLGLLLLPLPLSRVISCYFVSSGSNYIMIFGGFIVACVALLLTSVFYLKKKTPNFFTIPAKKITNIDTKNILLNIGLQLALNTFWIFDGILLNKSLSPHIYTSYTTFAFIYKFPFFISSSFLMVILGKNISSETEKKNFAKIVFRAVILILAIFLPVIAFEYFNTGYIHYMIGYGKYYIDGISLFFGLAWLLQTLVFILYTTSLKIAPKNKIVITEIIISSLTFIIGLIVFNSTLRILTLFLLSHGIIFLLLSSILMLRLIKRIKD